MGIRISKGNGNVLRFLQSCLTGLQTLNNNFFSFVTGVKEDLKFNGQKIYLERRLNDLYDNSQRRIYIINLDNFEITYVFRNSEDQTLFVDRIGEGEPPLYIARNNEELNDTNFRVMIPSGVDESMVRVTVDRYIISGLSYEVQVI